MREKNFKLFFLICERSAKNFMCNFVQNKLPIIASYNTVTQVIAMHTLMKFGLDIKIIMVILMFL